MNCMAYELSLIFVLIINWKWIACEYCRLFALLCFLFLVILSVFCYLRLLFSPQKVQDRLHHKQNCVHYPAYLSPLITETLCSISYFTLFWLQFITCPPCPHRFWASQSFCSCSYHLEFHSLGYSKQFYHILFYKAAFRPPYAPSHPSPAPQIRSVNRRHCALYKFIYLLTYLKVSTRVSSINNLKYVSVSWYNFIRVSSISIMILFSTWYQYQYHDTI